MRSKIEAKKIGIAGLSFLIPILIMATVYWNQGIYPGGKNTILVFDMRMQYVSFFASLKHIFSSGNSLFLNWSKGLGGNYTGTVGYYLMSPLNLFLLLFDIENLPIGIYYLTLIKFGLCGLSFSIYLLFSPCKRKMAGTINCIYVIPFAVAYALMSYNVMYSMSLMWLDGVILLPFVLWGLEDLFEGRIGVLTIALALQLFCNYYIAYMVFIFAAILFIMMIFIGYETSDIVIDNKLSVLKKYCLCNGIAVIVNLPLLILIISDLRNGKGQELGGRIDEQLLMHNPFDVLKQLFSGSYDSIFTGGLPSLFCGTLSLVFVLVFFVSKEQDKREKLILAAILTLLYLSMNISPLDKVWHGFRSPVCFPHRYSFLWSGIVLVYAFRGFVDLSNRKIKLVSMMMPVCALMYFVEMFFNSGIIIANHEIELKYTTAGGYNQAISDMSSALSKVSELNNGEDIFYRIEKDFQFSENDGLLMNYRGIEFFSSAYDRNILDFMRNMGMYQVGYKSTEAGETPFTDCLFGIKYMLCKHDLDPVYMLAGESKDIKIAQNPYWFGLGILCSDNGSIEYTDDTFENQNKLASKISGEREQIFMPVSYNMLKEPDENSDINTFSFIAPCSGYIYMKLSQTEDEKYRKYRGLTYEDRETKNIELSINGEGVVGSNKLDLTTNYCLGQFEEGEEVNVSISGYRYTRELYLYYYDDSSMEKWHNKLAGNQLIVSEMKNGSAVGTITCDRQGYLLLSMPYENNIRVKVDGVNTDTFAIYDTFEAVQLDEGIHNIEISSSAL